MTEPVGLWATLSFRDVEAMISWLKAVGFTEHAIYRDESEPAVVVHAEMLWPTGGGIMFGSERESAEWPSRPGTGATYLVTEDVDGVFKAAVSAGATVLREPRDEDYGGRDAAVVDPEGNLWSFGSYQPV